MKKIVLFLILMLSSMAFATSASEIEWWSQATYSNSPANTLKQWVEGMEGKAGGVVQGTGEIFYVDSNVTLEGDGSSWENARNTLDEAIGLCEDNRGDIIYVAQGHAETWTAVDSADLDVIGITVIGCGTGSDRPTFTYTGTTSPGELVIAAANVTIRNLVFSPGVADVVHAIEIEADADGSVIEFCEFTSGSTDAFEFVDAIQVTAAADDLIIRYNKATETTAGAVSWLDLSGGVVDNLSMYGNVIYGDYSTGAVDSTGRIQTLGYYGFNTITNLSSGDAAFYFNAAATGVMEFNRVFTDAEATAIDPGSMICFENYCSTAINVSGMITPVYDDGTIQLNATTVTAIASAVDALAGIGMIGLVETNTGGATEVISAALGGFGNDAFNEGWSLICIFDTGGTVGTSPSGDVRDITDYTSTGGVFTTAAFGAALTAGDYVLLTPTHLVPATYGKIIYCDDGGSNGEGTSWQTAKTTLEAAEAIAAAGDTILVGESHNENIGATATLNLAGLTVIGMGEGDTRPLLDFDTTATELTLDAAGITIKNLRFRPGASETVAAIVVGASGLGCTIDNCAWEVGEASGDEFIDGISVNAAAEGLTVKNCTAWNTNATAGAQDTWLNLDAVTVDDCTAIGNTVFGTYAEACIWGADAIPVNVNIQDNTLTNNITGQLAIEFQGAATGVIANNKLAGDTYGAILDPGSARCYGNTQTVGINSAAIDVPLVAGQTYALTKADGTAHSGDLFEVTGGPILITSLTGFCITAVGGQVTTTIICDTAVDKEFTTAVDIDALAEGGLLVFSDVNPAVLTILGVAANSGASSRMSPWYCPVGMIENVNDDATQTGVISWSMTFIPLTDGVAVVPK